MPGYDKTGPQGAGPMTGRGLGTCNETSTVDRPRGRGMRGWFQRRGRGLGLRQRAQNNKDRA